MDPGIVSDAWYGLRSGTSDYVGVSLVYGFGTNAVGQNRDGLEVQVGGFGCLFGDTAGGRDLAHDALLLSRSVAVRDRVFTCPDHSPRRRKRSPVPSVPMLSGHRLASFGNILRSMGKD